ncbi:hypothetical protein [Tabrizicola sp. BL-A-41-H6]|uniref:hypothetical protein n=1 Tax=Tabrizicola sp. BL-A-41-H6 TaxID=3421107 RepID=UPI003D67660B
MTSVIPQRSLLLTPAALPQPQPAADHRGPGLAVSEPTSQPQHRLALRQPEGPTASEHHLALPPPTTAEAAAEAARRAYIHASIAAGVNPLPLPGR